MKIVRGLLALGLVFSPVARAGTDDSKATPQVAPPPADQWFHALLQFDFSNAYITPRGLYVVNKGMTFQPLLLGFFDLYKNKDAFRSDSIAMFQALTGLWQIMVRHGALTAGQASVRRQPRQELTRSESRL